MADAKCPVYGNGWDAKVAECKDCSVDFPDEYEACKSLTVASKSNGKKTTPKAAEDSPKKESKNESPAPKKSAAAPEKESPAPEKPAATPEKEPEMEKPEGSEEEGGRKARVKSAVGKLTKEMIQNGKTKEEIVAVLNAEYLKDQSDEKYAKKMANFIYHRVRRELGLAKTRVKKDQTSEPEVDPSEQPEQSGEENTEQPAQEE